MMPSPRHLALLAPLVLTAPSPPAAAQDMGELARGMPSDVADLIRRRVECNHWSGEDPYDAERAAFIARAMRAARCDSLDADEATLARRHADRPEVLARLARAREQYW